MLRRTFTLLIVLFTFFVRPVFSSQPGPGSTELAEVPAPPLVSPRLLEKAGLRMLWQNKLPLKKSESLGRFFLRGDSVYVLSDHNYLFCLDTENGTMRFARPLVRKGLAVFDPQLFENQLLFVAGNTLLKMDPELGGTDILKRPSFMTTCPAVRNSDNIYLAGLDRRLHVFNAETGLAEFEAASDPPAAGSIITSIVATDQFVVFSTEAGNLVSIAADRPLRNWQFDAVGAISAPLILDDYSLFVASQDMNLYKIDAASGKPLWTFRAGSELVKAPRLTRKLAYQPAPEKGLYAIDKRTGNRVWQLPGGVELLAESGGKAYVITEERSLVVMDNNTAKELYRVNFAAVSKHAPNTTDARMYIADEAGRIACIRPVE